MGGSGEAELPHAHTVAISVREKVASPHALRAVRESGGAAVSATDAEIMEAVRLLGREGLSVEPASAVPVACALRLAEQGALQRDGRTVCILTSAGTKWPELLPETARRPHRIAPTEAELDTLLATIG